MTTDNAVQLTALQAREAEKAKRSARATWGYAASRGAALCTILALAYALVFLVYALIRSAFTVSAIDNPDASKIGTLFATWASLFVAVLVITNILGLLVAIVGAVTGLVINALSSLANRERMPQRAIGIGAVVCLVIVVLLHFALRSAINFSPSDLLSEHALFWL